MPRAAINIPSAQSIRHRAKLRSDDQLGETSEELVREAYGSHYIRLASIKKKYDPQNVLQLNQNIKPD